VVCRLKALKNLGHGLDTKIKELIPEFRLVDGYAEANCTVADLLSHHTGLPGSSIVFTRDLAKTPIVRPLHRDCPLLRVDLVQLERLSLISPCISFRERFLYSNIMYEVAALIVERLTGQRFPDYVRQEIIHPLSMIDTVHNDALSSATGYEPTLNSSGELTGEILEAGRVLHLAAAPGGSISMISSARDMESLPLPSPYTSILMDRVFR
jgi:CubicO group peptidase (beta-lactamase class C family)